MLSTSVSYLLALILLCFPEGRVRTLGASLFTALGVVFHMLLLHHFIDTPAGQNLSLANIFSFIACLWVLMVLVGSLRAKLLTLLWVVIPVALLSLGIQATAHQTMLIPLANQPIELWHVLATLGAYAFLGVAALQACVLLLQVQWVKRSPSVTVLGKLPPVEASQTLMVFVVQLGFALLTLGMIGGVVKLHTFLWTLNKSSLSLVAWLIYLVLLWRQHRTGLVARVSATWVLAGWLFLTFAYFGTKLISNY